MPLNTTDQERAKMAPALATFRTNAKQALHAARGASASESELRETLRKLHNHTEGELRAIFGEVRTKEIMEEFMRLGDVIQRRQTP
jgi:hypothetical protein